MARMKSSGGSHLCLFIRIISEIRGFIRLGSAAMFEVLSAS
jgi:hypothetical protein